MAIIVIKINLINIDLVIKTAITLIVTAMTIIIIRTIRISRTYTLFIRNRIIILRSIY